METKLHLFAEKQRKRYWKNMGFLIIILVGQNLCVGQSATGTYSLIKTLVPKSTSIQTIVFSPDGSTLASGGDDRIVHLWDVASGKLKYVLKGHNSYVNAVAFSPDGTLLASGSDDETIRLWDVRTGRLRRTLKMPGNPISALAFSPDGAFLASGVSDGVGTTGAITLWRTRDYRKIRTILFKIGVSSLAISPDKQRLASGNGANDGEDSYSGDATIVSLIKGKKSLLHSDNGVVHSVAFSFDGEKIAVGRDFGFVELWNVKTSKLERSLPVPDYSLAVAFSPRDSTLAASNGDGTVSLWDMKSKFKKKILQTGYTTVRTIAYSPKGNLFASAGNTGNNASIKIWRVE